MKVFSQLVGELVKKGYKVRFDTCIAGKSGALHRITMLVDSAPDKEGTRDRVVCITERGKREPDALEMIRVFAVTCDLDAKACYILESPSMTKFLNSQSIMGSLLYQQLFYCHTRSANDPIN